MRILKRQAWLVGCLAVVSLVVLANWSSPRADGQTDAPGGAMMAAGPTKAICMVHGLGDNKVEGKVTFTQQDGGVEIAAELTGLKPGKHGFHVHEFGDCSKMDGTCAGAHFNPDNKQHGGPDSPERHAGDFGNIEAGPDGMASYKRVDNMISLSGSHSIIGRAIIVHEKPDDLKTPPSGDAGARIGCGVIGIADPKM